MALTLKDLEKLRRNPLLMQHTLLKELGTINGDTVFFENPTHPVVNSIEAVVLTTASMLEDMDSTIRKITPSQSTTWNELYRHLSDEDYLNLYSLPSSVSDEGIYLLFIMEEILAKAVTIDNSTIRQLTIPKHTQIMIGEIPFTLEYPINIRINEQGNLQVIYDTSEKSPIQTLDTNQVEHQLILVEGYEALLLKVPMSQYEVNVHTIEIGETSTLKKEISLPSNFYYVEALMYNTIKKTWSTIKTTHSQEVYDVVAPTVALSVSDSLLTAYIPRVYQNSGLLTGRIKLRVYTTQGPIVRNLSNYSPDQVQLRLGGEDGVDTIYSSPLGSLEYFSVYSVDTTEGGRAPLDFNTVRKLVMNRSIDNGQQPITKNKLSTSLTNKGYTITPSIDNATHRTFLASRALPAPTGLRFTNAITGRIGTYTFSMSSLALNENVYDNGSRLTLSPSATFELVGGVVKLLNPSDTAMYTPEMSDSTLLELNSRKLLFTPFHYVIDSTSNLFRIRPYYLSAPTVDSRVFIGSNDALGLTMNSKEVLIAAVDDGFELVVTTSYDDTIAHLDPETQSVVAQLAFIPSGSSDYAYLNGDYIGDIDGAKTFKFHIDSSFDVDANDLIYLNNFNLYDTSTRQLPATLSQTFNITFSIVGFSVQKEVASTLSDYVGVNFIEGTSYVISVEQFNVTLGRHIINFWDSVDSYIGDVDYLRHTTDKELTYPETEYKAIGTDGEIFLYDGTTGTLEYVKTAQKGDTVVIDGEIQYEWRAGDVVYEGGVPVVRNQATIERQADFYFLDGRFKFVTDTQVIDYLASIPNTIADWASTDLVSISNDLIERSGLKFYPKTTLGDIPVIMNANTVGTISAEQSLLVTFYLSGNNVTSTLKGYLKQVAKDTINTVFKQTVVSRDDIVTKLKASVGDHVVGIDVTGLGGEALDLDIVTLDDETKTLSLLKKISRLTDGTLSVNDDVTVAFVKHD